MAIPLFNVDHLNIWALKDADPVKDVVSGFWYLAMCSWIAISHLHCEGCFSRFKLTDNNHVSKIRHRGERRGLRADLAPVPPSRQLAEVGQGHLGLAICQVD